MELKDTVSLERFKAEHYWLRTRTLKLKGFLDNWDKLDFTPTCLKELSVEQLNAITCPKEFLKEYLNAMTKYKEIIMREAGLENIKL